VAADVITGAAAAVPAETIGWDGEDTFIPQRISQSPAGCKGKGGKTRRNDAKDLPAYGRYSAALQTLKNSPQTIQQKAITH
jgi:hypothetical protein